MRSASKFSPRDQVEESGNRCFALKVTIPLFQVTSVFSVCPVVHYLLGKITTEGHSTQRLDREKVE